MLNKVEMIGRCVRDVEVCKSEPDLFYGRYLLAVSRNISKKKRSWSNRM